MKKLPYKFRLLQQSMLSFVGLYDLKNVIDGLQCELLKNVRVIYGLRFLSGKTDPYVVLSLGDQLIRSKKNSQTTVLGPSGEPIWNQVNFSGFFN